MSNLNREIPTEESAHSQSRRDWDIKPYSLSYREIVEILYYIYQSGYLSREFHDPLYDLKFELEAQLDKFVPNWTPETLSELVKEAREK